MWTGGRALLRNNAFHGLALVMTMLAGNIGCGIEEPLDVGTEETPLTTGRRNADRPSAENQEDSQELLWPINGATLCTTPGQCPSGFCVDGVCCDAACTAMCQACTAAKKGSGIDGVCGFISNASDPDNECLFGNCNGSGGCTKGGILLGNGSACSTSSQCSSSFCVDGVCCNSACTATCQACTAAKKGNGSDGTCDTIALATDPDNECAAGNCNGLGACGANPGTLPNGAACASKGTCLSGNCTDGVCCDSSCSSTCQACTTAKKGSGANGVCGNIAAASDPDNECAFGNCNGFGACSAAVLYGNGVACTANAQCNSGVCTDGVCCNEACTASCKACNMSEQIGTCTETSPGACIGQCAGALGLPNAPWLTKTGPLGAGDLNGDGRDDLVVGNHVFLARGSGLFDPPVQYPIIEGVVQDVVDVDGDGNRDVVTLSTTHVNVIKNLGNGTLSGKIAIAISGGPSDADTGDVNGDGKIDIVTTVPSTSKVTVYLNLGGGTFAPGVDYTGFAAKKIDLADMDGDGDRDLVLMKSNSFRILVNQGNGTFVVGTTTVTDMYGNYLELATADIDSDGDTDILMTDLEYCSVRIKLNPGNGAYPPITTDLRACTSFKYNHPLTVTDFDGDAKADLFYGFGDKLRVYLKLNQSTTQMYDVGDYPAYLVAGDFDGDGDMDGAVANSNSDDVSILINNGSGAFPSNVSTTILTSTNKLLQGSDVNSDGVMDIVGITSSGIDVRIGLGNAAFSAPINYPTSGGPSNLATGDINGDGKPDIAVAHGSSLVVGIMMNQGNGTYGPEVDQQTGWYPRGVALADVNRDNKNDLVVGSYDSVTVHMNQGMGAFGNPDTYTIGSYSKVVVMDINNDGWTDIVVSPSDSGGVMQLGTLINQGNGLFVRGADIAVIDKPDLLARDDFDNDGLLDLAVLHWDLHAVTTLHNNGDGTFAGFSMSTLAAQVSLAVTGLATGDINRDGIPDIIAPQSSINGVTFINVAVGDGNGAFYPWTEYASKYGSGMIIPADFNGDGHLDIAYGTGIGINIAFNTCLP